MMTSDALEILRQANDSLRSALLRLRPEQRQCSAIRPQELSDLLAQLLRAGECLRRLPAHLETAAALQQESLEYRRNLEKLRDFLPGLQGRLLAEKARLEGAKAQVAAAAAWARASKKTL